MNDGLDNWLSEDIEISKNRIVTKPDIDHDMSERWHRDRYKESHLPAEFWSLTLDDNWISKQDIRGNDLTRQQAKKKQAALEFVQKYISVISYVCRGKLLKKQTKDGQRSHGFHSMVLIGGEGSGKSFLAAEIAKAAVLRGEDVRWYDYCALTNTMLSRSYTVEEEQHQIIQDFESMALIVVDAVETDKIDDKGRIALKSLARARRASGLPWIITCKHDALQVTEHPFSELINSQYAHKIVLPTS